MTSTTAWLSNEIINGWYVVRESPRGAAIGRVRSNGPLRWIGTCVWVGCKWTVEGRTRPAVANEIGRHNWAHNQ